MQAVAELTPSGHEVEVSAKATRRRFTNEYKRRMLRQADACKRPGELGALLRREGLYSSNLTAWRAARDRGELGTAAPKKRGPKAAIVDPRDKLLVEKERELRRWKARAERAEGLVEVQKKVAELLGINLDENGERR